METVLLLAVTGAVNVLCFVMGAKVGQAVQKGEKIETPSVNPLKAVREREERREAKAEQDRIAIIMKNIENYDGTPNGQEDVPRKG